MAEHQSICGELRHMVTMAHRGDHFMPEDADTWDEHCDGLDRDLDAVLSWLREVKNHAGVLADQAREARVPGVADISRKGRPPDAALRVGQRPSPSGDYLGADYRRRRRLLVKPSIESRKVVLDGAVPCLRGCPKVRLRSRRYERMLFHATDTRMVVNGLGWWTCSVAPGD